MYRKKSSIAIMLFIILAALSTSVFVRYGSPDVSKASRMRSAAKAIAWLRTQQQSDGSFGDITLTAEIAEAVSDAGENVRSKKWTPNGISLYKALENQTREYMKRDELNAGVIAKIVLGVLAAGGDPRSFAGHDLVKALESTYNENSALYHETNMFGNALALLAMAKAGKRAPERAVKRVLMEKRARGCWGWQVEGEACDTDTTAVTMLALAANGVRREKVDDVLQFLEREEHRDAGWGSWDSQKASNVNSTAWVLLALKAFGEDPRSSRWSKRLFLEKTNPLERLLNFQHTDGSFWYLDDQEGGKVLATCEALLAVTKDYPGDKK